MAHNKRPRVFGPDEQHRWNSTYVMLKEVIGHRDVVTMWINKELNETFLTDRDWETANMILEFLQVFYLATTAFSTVYSPSSHIALHNIFEISERFARYRNHESLGTVLLKMEAKFLKYYGKLPMLYCFGIVLDPRFRLQRLTNILRCIGKNLNRDYVGTHLDLVEEKFRAVYGAYEEETQQDATQSPVHIPVQAFESPVKRNWSRYEDDAREAAQQSGVHYTPPGSQGDELERYLRTGMVMPFEEIDVLQWWKQHEKDFPVLSKFARDVLTIPVSTISSESAFSLSGRILDNRRMSLTPEMVEALTCLKDWELAERRQQDIIRHTDEMSEYFSSLNVEEEPGPSNR